MSNQKEPKPGRERADDGYDVVATAIGEKDLSRRDRGWTRNGAYNDLVTLVRQLLHPRLEGADGFRARWDVGFSLKRGTILRLSGAHGSGEFGLLKILAGVTKSSTGPERLCP